MNTAFSRTTNKQLSGRDALLNRYTRAQMAIKKYLPQFVNAKSGKLDMRVDSFVWGRKAWQMGKVQDKIAEKRNSLQLTLSYR